MGLSHISATIPCYSCYSKSAVSPQVCTSVNKLLGELTCLREAFELYKREIEILFGSLSGSLTICNVDMSVTLLLSCIYLSSDRHHLQFVYTVLTKPDGFSGPVFSAVGLYDDRRISHYSNEERTWKRDCLDAEIWRNTKEPDYSRDWFINLVNTLANCTSSRCDGESFGFYWNDIIHI